MKTFLKISLLILSISLVSCKISCKDDFSVVELKDEPATVRMITDLPDYFENNELFYLELINPNPQLPAKALNVVNMVGSFNSLELFEPYKTEDLTVIIGGVILVMNPKSPTIPVDVQINDISFHNITLKTIEAAE